MKKHFSFLPLAFSLLFFSFLSCRKNKMATADIETHKTAFSIEDAKTGYEKFTLIKPASDRTSSSGKIENFTPLWSLGITGEDENNYTVECPVKFDKTHPGFVIHPSSRSSDTNNIKEEIKLLVLKNKATGMITPALMHIFSANTQGSEITYKPRNTHFTGFIFFTDLNEAFVNGWQYENGEIVKRSTSNQQVNGKALPPDGGGGTDCYTLVTDWYVRDCIEYYNGNYQCGEWDYSYTTYQTYCSTGGSSGGGGGSYEEPATDCSAMTAAYSSGVQSVSQLESISLASENGETRTKKYVWTFAMGTFNPSLKWKSYETGVHFKDQNEWKWQSLTHDYITKEGVIIGGSLDCKVNAATATLGIYWAIMALDYTFSWSLVCKGFPVNGSENLNASKPFNVND